jgi:hypothetical protein
MTYQLQSSDLSDDEMGDPVSIPSAAVDPNLATVFPSSDQPGEAPESEEDEGGLNNQSRPRSWIWMHGTRVQDDKGTAYWKCSYCKRFAN